MRPAPGPACDAEKHYLTIEESTGTGINKQIAMQFYSKTSSGTYTKLHTPGSGAGRGCEKMCFNNRKKFWYRLKIRFRNR
jgi:hypothetical protein